MRKLKVNDFFCGCGGHKPIEKGKIYAMDKKWEEIRYGHGRVDMARLSVCYSSIR